MPDRLFHNEGGGRFKDVSEAAGITRAFGPGLGVACADFNGDGWPDFYVANDGAANQLWINRGDGTFEDQGLLSGTAYNADGLPQGSMGLAVGDFDGDADEDILVTNLPREGSTLYVNDGAGRFQDASEAWGLRAPSLRTTGFGTAFFDYDNDGWLDLFVANGAVNLVQAAAGQPVSLRRAEPALPQPGPAALRGGDRTRPAPRARGGRPGRGFRRRGRGRRHRHSRHQQQRAGAASAQRGRRAGPLAAGAAPWASRTMPRGRERAWRSCAEARPRSGAGPTPTEAT